jgi:hypothetical protein
MASADRYPVLSGALESSVPGLYFAGAAAVPSLGPYMRFVAGSGFAARRLARHIARRARREGHSRSQVFVSPEITTATGASAAGGREVVPVTSAPGVIEKSQ